MRLLHLSDDTAITRELLTRTRAFNYIPATRMTLYGEARLREYHGSGGGTRA